MRFLFLPALFFHFITASAQVWAPDPSFGTDGKASFSHAKGNERIRSLIRLSDGRILTAGQALRRTRDVMLTRLSATGQTDNTFGTNGVAYLDFQAGADQLNAAAVQPADGKILVAANTGNANNPCGIARFLPNGSVDSTFGTNGLVLFKPFPTGSGATLNDLLLAPDGRILVCGYQLMGNAYRAYVRRYLSTGAPDLDFGTAGTVTLSFSTAAGSHYAEKLAPGASGEIWVLGNYYSNRFLLGLAKLKANGQPDSSFSADGILTHSFNTTGENNPVGIHALDQGRVLVCGYANTNSANYKGHAARFLANGTLDNTYGTNGLATMASGTSFNGLYGTASLADGSLLATGETFAQNRYRGTVFKLTPAGQPDNSFGTSGLRFFSNVPADAFGNAVTATPSGVWAAGAEYISADNAYQSLVVGLTPAGLPLPGFGTNGLVYKVTTQPATIGRRLHSTSTGYWVSGHLDNVDLDQFVAQVGPNGSAGAQPGGGGLSKVDFGSRDQLVDHHFSATGDGIQLANTGSVNLAFTGLGTFSSSPDYSLVKISPSAGIQESTQKKFRFANTHFTQATVLRVDPQGRPVVLAFQGAPTQSAAFFQRHKAGDLSLDSSFGTNGRYSLFGFSFPTEISIPDFLIDENGDYLVLRQFSSGSQPGFRLSKTTPTFSPVTSFGNGSILPGTYELFAPSSEFVRGNRLFRLNTGYLVMGERNGNPLLVQIAENGASAIQIPLPGFTSLSRLIRTATAAYYVVGLNAQNRVQVVRISANGTIDPDFNGGTGLLTLNTLNTPSQIRDAVLDAEGRMVFLVGDPKADGAGEDLTLVRYTTVQSTADVQKGSARKGFVYPNPASDRVYWSEGKERPSRVRVLTTEGREVMPPVNLEGGEGLDVSALPPGLYQLSWQNAERIEVLGFLKP